MRGGTETRGTGKDVRFFAPIHAYLSGIEEGAREPPGYLEERKEGGLSDKMNGMEYLTTRRAVGRGGPRALGCARHQALSAQWRLMEPGEHQRRHGLRWDWFVSGIAVLHSSLKAHRNGLGDGGALMGGGVQLLSCTASFLDRVSPRQIISWPMC